MLLPLRTDSPLRTTPYANWVLIAANVLFFALQAADDRLKIGLALSPRFPHVYAFISYQFLHANIVHLGGNMLFLYIFGNNVNDKMGNVGYAAFYLAGGVVAGCAYVLTQHTPAPIIGASGSIAAVTGAYLILFPRSHITIIYWFMLIGRIEIQALWFVALFFVQDVMLGSLHGRQDEVAHMAHIGGTLFGTVVCLALLIPQLLPRDQFDVWALIQRWNKRRQYRDLVAKGYNPFDYGTTTPGRGRQPPIDGRVVDLREQINGALSRHDAAEAADLYVQMKTIDGAQVLSRQAQQDVATQLHQSGRYPEAAEAYETLLRTYPKFDRADQIELMLGVLYARYLFKYDKAKTHLTAVAGRLHGGRELDMARDELAAIAAIEAKTASQQP